MKFKTKGNGSPNGKRRVYFTCHPADFDRSFEKLKDDIFKTHDVAIYYNDFADPNDVPASDADLEQMNLLVIPVSFKFLSEPSRARENDLEYAKKEHIPVLPVMLETGLDALYKNYFGTLEYISPYLQDATAISYEDKLKKYLDSVLVGNEMAERIRKAFDAYIFLSYRKKDRQYANSLMRLIHSNPICRDIAIWYDEFLVPGEAFDQAIEEAMKKSKLFTLLVTPHLIERDENNLNIENYVETIEYPRAYEAGKPILPVEMEQTDREQLEIRYQGIPACVIPDENDEFYDQFIRAVEREGKSENDDDPMHNFLIGLAYLEGIDVEVNRERAVELITGAAEAGLPEAMEKLSDMYYQGIGVEANWALYVEWLARCSEACPSIRLFENLSEAYIDVDDHVNAAIIHMKLFRASEKKRFYARLIAKDFAYAHQAEADEILRSDTDTLESVLDLLTVESVFVTDRISAYFIFEKDWSGRWRLKYRQKQDDATEIFQLTELYVRIFGNSKSARDELLDGHSEEEIKELLDTYAIFLGFFSLAGHMTKRKHLYSDYEKLIEIGYRYAEEHYGYADELTLFYLGKVIEVDYELKQYDKMLADCEKLYKGSSVCHGNNHPDTITAMGRCGIALGYKGEHVKAIEVISDAVQKLIALLGADDVLVAHGRTDLAKAYLDYAWYVTGDYSKAIELYELSLTNDNLHSNRMFWIYCELGEAYLFSENYEKAIKTYEKANRLSIYCECEKEVRLIILDNMAVCYYHLGKYDEALRRFRELAEREGYANSQYGLGAMYANGDGVEKDRDEAIKWFMKAAEQGHEEAKNQLGILTAKS